MPSFSYVTTFERVLIKHTSHYAESMRIFVLMQRSLNCISILSLCVFLDTFPYKWCRNKYYHFFIFIESVSLLSTLLNINLVLLSDEMLNTTKISCKVS